MTRDEAQDAWEEIVDKGFSDYQKLTREQRVWFNVEPLTTDGLWDHYVNHGADKNADTILDLEYLNFNSIADQLREFNKTYFPNGVPEGPDARQDEFDKFDEDELEDYIEEMDDKFWELSDDLENALMKHINNTGIGK
ncbi:MULTISPECIES: DUF4375 domain-containing protein [Nonlabens]|uniref:Uncharacterized protein DUF4375 n=1 Tax=Nonlabens xylanidelens TaxID=191564 RepID=A0A2S6IL14_9FLAO|nr:DUF4375 domain-containing protein [Nonlabens xylanidelens]PPK94922.1 uncharacterized protein DUF4375 [Nonlabens xylanidelens]PQJ17470.1 hypothetical protein BST94_10445 [Nonlabens xylanidelens]